MTILIERLSERAHDPKGAVDEERDAKDDNGKRVAAMAQPPATEAQITAAEARLGFRLPELLRQLYRDVGNGGFGPGHGLYGVPASPGDEPDSVVGRHPNEATWPAGLLPICDWGSGIISCLDCLQPDAPVIRLDPNMPKRDVTERVPTALHYDKAARVKDACWIECGSFEEWLEGWVNGASLFYAAYGGATEGEDEEEDLEENDEDL